MAPSPWIASGKQQPGRDDNPKKNENHGGLFRAIRRKASLKTTSSNEPSKSTINIQQTKPRKHNFVELGSIDYVNLTPDCRHGDLSMALKVASETGKPIFANFAEWSG